MIEDVGGRASAGTEYRKSKFSDYSPVAHGSVRNHSSRSSHFQTSCQNGTTGRRSSVAATVLHENVPRRTGLDAFALGIFRVEKYVEYVDVFSGRNVSQRQRATDYVAVTNLSEAGNSSHKDIT